MNRITTAALAVSIALAGTAWAAGLDRDSVKSKQIKDNSVQSIDVADGAIASADLGDGAVTSAKLEATLATKTLTAHHSFPADGNPIELMNLPGVSVITGRCNGRSNTTVGYTNASTVDQSVAFVTGGGLTAGAVEPGKGSTLGANTASVEGRIRVAMPGQYLDADVFIAHPSGDEAACEAWTKVTVTPGG